MTPWELGADALTCAECGTTTADTYVVTFTSPGREGRTEVCRDCDAEVERAKTHDILSTAPADALREHDAALIESLADEIVVEPEADLPDDFLRGFDTGADAVYAALREKARERREGGSR